MTSVEQLLRKEQVEREEAVSLVVLETPRRGLGVLKGDIGRYCGGVEVAIYAVGIADLG